MAIKFVLVEIVLVETVLVGDPLYHGNRKDWGETLFAKKPKPFCKNSYGRNQMALRCFLKSLRMPSAPVTKLRSDRLMNIKEIAICFLYLLNFPIFYLINCASRNFVREEDGSRILKNSAHKSSRLCLKIRLILQK